MRLYSLCLKIEGTPCVVIGGGNVAQRKVVSLVECGARVTVVSPALCEPLEALAASGVIEVVRREFHESDLRGARLAIAATNDRTVNEAVAAAARCLSVLLNVVDVPDLCDFYVPASVRRGKLEVAVSTTGAFPALAKRLRAELELRFGPEYELYLDLLESLRAEIKVRIPEIAERNRAEQALLETPVLDMLAKGGIEEARELLGAVLAPWLKTTTSG